MNDYDYGRFIAALRERQTEVRLDIKRTEQRTTDLYAELLQAETAIEHVLREQAMRNEL